MTMPLSAHLPLPLAAAGEGLDYLEIARNSGPVGITVLVLLLGASAVCWAIIVRKWLQIRRAQDESVKFLETFWQSKRLDAIYQAAEALRPLLTDTAARARATAIARELFASHAGAAARRSRRL